MVRSAVKRTLLMRIRSRLVPIALLLLLLAADPWWSTESSSFLLVSAKDEQRDQEGKVRRVDASSSSSSSSSPNQSFWIENLARRFVQRRRRKQTVSREDNHRAIEAAAARAGVGAQDLMMEKQQRIVLPQEAAVSDAGVEKPSTTPWWKWRRRRRTRKPHSSRPLLESTEQVAPSSKVVVKEAATTNKKENNNNNNNTTEQKKRSIPDWWKEKQRLLRSSGNQNQNTSNEKDGNDSVVSTTKSNDNEILHSTQHHYDDEEEEADDHDDDDDDDDETVVARPKVKLLQCRGGGIGGGPPTTRRQRRRRRRLRQLLSLGRRLIRIPGRQLRRRRREAHVRMAYRMALLASLAYWEFQKRLWPATHDCGFRLLLRQPERSRSRRRNKLIDFSFICHVIDSTIVDGAENMVIIVEKHYQDDETHSPSRRGRFCRSSNMKSDDKNDDEEYTRLEYYFHNWHEPTLVGANWHDTDLLVATTTAKSNNQQRQSALVLSFAGTSSAADALTDLQTFEPIQHSGIFSNHDYHQNITGSVHRGFLNAYSRVKHGSVLRLCDPSDNTTTTINANNRCTSHATHTRNHDRTNNRDSLVHSLHERYGHCSLIPLDNDEYDAAVQATLLTNRSHGNGSDNDMMTAIPESKTKKKETIIPNKVKRRKKGGCRHFARDAENAKLIDVLRQVVIEALENGRAVHVTGHSLGGGLATLLALDIIINFPHVPLHQFHLWTFGAPQVVDDVFMKSAMQACPRLESYIRSANGHAKNRRHDSSGGRLHRFVTLTNDCEVDIVSTIASQALSPHHSLAQKTKQQQQQEPPKRKNKRNLHGRLARRLGGVRGSLVHMAEPYYLLPPSRQKQQSTASSNSSIQSNNTGTNRNKSDNINTNLNGPSSPSQLSSNTVVEIHRTMNYLQGISRESVDHPLTSDLPRVVQNAIGEHQLA